jgi:hypothetical protein
MVKGLATLSDDDWTYLLARWEAIRAAQRAHIMANPGCIADRLERQRWLSRLLAATPRILAATEYARIRRAIDPAAAPSRIRVQVVGEDGRPVAAEAAAEAPAQIAATAITGAQEDGTRPLAQPIPPALDDRAPIDEVRRQRGYRRAKDDIATGYDELAASE